MSLSAIPDEVLGFTGANWPAKGLCPVYLYRLIADLGWTYTEVDFALSILIGHDYAEVKCGDWIDRLEAKGIDTGLYHEKDDVPFLYLLDKLVFVVNQKAVLH